MKSLPLDLELISSMPTTKTCTIYCACFKCWLVAKTIDVDLTIYEFNKARKTYKSVILLPANPNRNIFCVYNNSSSPVTLNNEYMNITNEYSAIYLKPKDTYQVSHQSKCVNLVRGRWDCRATGSINVMETQSDGSITNLSFIAKHNADGIATWSPEDKS